MTDFVLLRVCKIPYFEKCHNQLLYERMRKFSHMVSLVEAHASIMVAAPQHSPSVNQDRLCRICNFF